MQDVIKLKGCREHNLKNSFFSKTRFCHGQNGPPLAQSQKREAGEKGVWYG